MILTAAMMLRAYATGLFPMADDASNETIYWYDPDPRGVLPLEAFHIPHKLRKTIRKRLYNVKVDTAFDEVVSKCAEPRDGRTKTWLNPKISQVCSDLYRLGFGHSIEAWNDNELVGGLYGIALGSAFFGESMFSTQTDASKIALVHLVARLKRGGFQLLDTQFVTEHLKQFGAIEIPRDDYLQQLGKALQNPGTFHLDAGEDELVEELLQLISQISYTG